MLCVEAFPRSGSAYAFTLIRNALGVPPERLAGHTHSPVNVRRAIRHRVPAIVLSREPLSCCLSLMVMGACRTLEDALRAYHRFHAAILSLSAGAAAVAFEAMVETPEQFLRRVAKEMGREPPEWDEGLIEIARRDRMERDRMFNGNDPLRSSLPNIHKEARKQYALRYHLTPAAKHWLGRCEEIRAEFLADRSSRT